ncbi:hypothetical protein [Halomicrococcus sp. SG-WS-1]|uniref:hypothetical protein n=1 Tax=Halomicrococcus sp. SG-WS-1 TaxID=3439057 RepID=UPI003F7A8A99
MHPSLTPLAVLGGTTLVSYCLWQLVFDPFRGPLPGRRTTVVVLVAGTVAGVALTLWGLDRLDLLRRP